MVVLAFIPRAAAAQGGEPLGLEFRVNTYTTGIQADPAMASDSSGNFVVVWASRFQDGSEYGVFGQRYASTGAPLGPEFRVNTHTTKWQLSPAVASDSSGNFVVVWYSSSDQDGSKKGIFGQRYASTGAPLGPEFRVNTYTTNSQYVSAVASDSSGNFVVVWRSSDGFYNGVFGQRYDSTGVPLGPEFRVNTYTTNDQRRAAVASDASGNFVVVWESAYQDGDQGGIFGQRYASTGAPLGPEFPVNTYTTYRQWSPAVASDSSGNLVVVWESYHDGSYRGVFGQRYASSGTPLGPEFRVNTYTTNSQYYPAVASDSSGNFVVVWQGSSQDGSQAGVFGQRYAGTGAPLGPEFRVNTFTTNKQHVPALASDSSGNFVVVWQGSSQDGSQAGVFGQRYGRIVPVELMHFEVE